MGHRQRSDRHLGPHNCQRRRRLRLCASRCPHRIRDAEVHLADDDVRLGQDVAVQLGRVCYADSFEWILIEDYDKLPSTITCIAWNVTPAAAGEK